MMYEIYMYMQANFEIAGNLYDLYVICVTGMLGKFILFLLTKPPCFLFQQTE